MSVKIKIKCEIVKKYPAHSGIDVVFFTDDVPRERISPVHIAIPPGLPQERHHDFIMSYAPGADWFDFEARRARGEVADLSLLSEGQVIAREVATPEEGEPPAEFVIPIL